jgi:hypothetical protein
VVPALVHPLPECGALTELVMVGAWLSILTFEIGPAVTQAPTLSQTCTEFVEAFGLVVPAGADAVSVTVPWVPAWLTTTPVWAGAKPEPESVTVHVNETVPVDQLVPADGQCTTGAVLSIMNPVMAGIGVQLPTLSQSWPDDVDASEVAVPAGTEVLNVTLPVLDVPPAMPDCGSEPVQVTVWSVENQVVGATEGVHSMLLGAVAST